MQNCMVWKYPVLVAFFCFLLELSQYSKILMQKSINREFEYYFLKIQNACIGVFVFF